MGDKRAFDTKALLSVASGYMLTDFAKVHEVIEFVMDQPVLTHQLPEVQPIASSFIVQQHPWLGAIHMEDEEPTERKLRRADLAVERFGETLEIIAFEGAPKLHWMDGLKNLGRLAK